MEVPTWMAIFKWINIVGALLIGAMGIYSLVTLKYFTNFDFWQLWSIFSPFFMIVFALMLLAIEFKGEIIAEYFQFVMTFLGRGIFYIFLGSVAAYQPASYAESTTVIWLWGLALWLVGIFYIVMHFISGGVMGEVKQAISEKYGTVE